MEISPAEKKRRAKLSIQMKKLWQDPEFRKLMSRDHPTGPLSERGRRRLSRQMKKRWQDPVYRADIISKYRATNPFIWHEAELAIGEKWAKRTVRHSLKNPQWTVIDAARHMMIEIDEAGLRRRSVGACERVITEKRVKYLR
ncbi:MAG: hypothetical protein R6X12_06460 [bacterium]